MRITIFDKSEEEGAVNMVKVKQAEITIITEVVDGVYIYKFFTSNKKVSKEIENMFNLISLKKNF